MDSQVLPRPTYIPLRNHSAYSLLEGAMPVDLLIQSAVSQKLPALALCDSANLFGAMEFSLACQKASIQPLLGCQLMLQLPDIGGQGHSSSSRGFPLPVYVQNEEGYRNLCRLVTDSTVRAQPDAFGQLTLSQLAGRTEGLIGLTGGQEGALNTLLRHQDTSKAHKHLELLETLFPGRLYIELNRYESGPAAEEEALVHLAYTRDLPLIATNEAYFFSSAHHPAHDALLCVAEGSYVSVAERRFVTPNHRLRSSQDMQAVFKDLPEALENTVRLAQRCHFLLRSRPPQLPPYPTQEEGGEAAELRIQAKAGLEDRLSRYADGQAAEEFQVYRERLAYELEVIIQMGFAGYFLIVADFIGWAKGQRIPVGPGRGSGAGSVVAWALKITDVDPLRFHLLFERFLNPERVSMPDFDVDFCQERRDEVIHYVQQKYGEDKVAHIITFGKLQARAVLRDVGRVLQMPYSQVDQICKKIPNNPAHPVSLQEAIALDPELRAQRAQDPEVDQLLEFAQQLEGLYRHASTHAAGVVIGGEALVNLLPLYQDLKSALPATQFSMKYVELAGLVKFDFLGLKTLTVMQETLNLLEKEGVNVDLSTLPLDDPLTFELLRRVETQGLFQLESAGMNDVLRRLQPERFEEIIALVALYRPGPMDDIPRYIACRHGHETVTYPYACLESILKETFGVMVYQEQVLQIARTLAGYSLGEADLLRRAMGKKIQSEMDAQRKIFVDGVLANHGGTQEHASQLFDQIAKFAGYAFPKAHAAPYALITYQTAYLKANFPVHFMAASMTLDAHNTDKVAVFAQEVRRMGIPLLAPDVNHSDVLFRVESTPEGRAGIRYGLAALKNVGRGAMEGVVHERQKAGPFSSLYDFFERLSDSKILNKRQMEGLIQAGAFDTLHPNRQEILESLEMLLKYGTQTSNRLGLFTLEETRPPLTPCPPFTVLEQLRHEFAAVGFYLSHHPLDVYQENLNQVRAVPSSQLGAFLETNPPARPFTMAGALISKKEKVSRAGSRYAFLQLSDPHGVYEVTVFSEILAKYRPLFEPGNGFVLVVTGRIEEDAIRLSVQEVQELDTLLAHHLTALEVTLDDSGTVDKSGKLEVIGKLEGLADILGKAPPGDTGVSLCLTVPHPSEKAARCRVRFKLAQSVQASGDLKSTLERLSRALS